MKVLAIDPGPTESAFAVYDGDEAFGRKVSNTEMLRVVADPIHELGSGGAFIDAMAVEMVASYGMPVGAEVFDTCVFIGRLLECWSTVLPGDLVFRREVKLHMCGVANAKDSNIRQAVIDRFGGKSAIGKKKTPGKLYGVSGDVWQALALAVTYYDKHVRKEAA